MAKIRLDADARAALAEFDKLVQAQDGVAEGQDAIAGKSREAAAEERRLGGLRRKLLRETNTAQETFKQKLNNAAKALKGVDGAERRLGEVRERLTTEYLEDLRKQQESLGEVEGGLDEVGNAGDSAFDAAKVVGWGAAVGVAGAAVAGITELLRGMRAEADQAGEAFGGIVNSSGSLVQLAGADAALRDKLFAASDTAFASGIPATRTAADELVFQLQAGGRLDELDFFTRVGAIDDGAALAEAAGVIESAFRGSGEDVGTGIDLVSKALAAASPVTGVESSDILTAVAEVAPAARPFGLSDEELFGAVSVVAGPSGSASKAATQLTSLLSQLARQGLADDLRGQGFGAILRGAREAAGPSAAEQIEFLGGSEAARAFRPLENPQQFRSRLSQIVNAQAIGLAEDVVANALSSDRIRPTIAARAAAAQEVLLKDSIAVREQLADAEQDAFTSFIRENFGDTAAFTTERSLDLARFAPGVDQVFADNRRDFLSLQDEARTGPLSPRSESLAEEQAKLQREQLTEQKKTNTHLRNLNVGIPAI